MRAVDLNPGDVLYSEGDESDNIYFVETGKVEVRRGVGKDEVTLATLGKGEILGEMGVIQNTKRSASVVAATQVRLASLDGPVFLQTFGGVNGGGLKILRMICDRLATTNNSLGAAPPKEHALRREVGEIRLLGASPEMQEILGKSGIVIDNLPFDIGITSPGPVVMNKQGIGLPISGEAPQLSARHLRIELGQRGRLVVRDLESQFGSVVNGRRISAFERMEDEPIAGLHMGENEIVAGGVYSPIRFTLRLRPALAKAA